MKKLNLSTQITIIGAFTLLLIFSSCSSGNEEKANNSSLPTIDLVEAYDNRAEVPLSTFAESVKYIPLETIEKSLIARSPIFQVTDENIIVSAFHQVLVFDITNGRFLREIGTLGEGPNEYQDVDRYFEESFDYTYVRTNKGKHFGLNSKGENKHIFISPSSDSTFVTSFTQINDTTFVGFHSNYNCNQKYKLIFFNESGKEIKLISNLEKCINENPNSIHFLEREGIFSKERSLTYFKETFNDTLYQVANLDLKPEVVFDLGSNGIPYQERIVHTSPDSKLDFFEPRLIDISQSHIFIQLTTKNQTFNGIFNRVTGETLLSDIGRTEMHGFVNDLDNFLPLVPQYATDKNQLVGYIEAPDVLAWFKENPDKAAQLPANLKKLGQIKPDDNPVVMIVDLKD